MNSTQEGPEPEVIGYEGPVKTAPPSNGSLSQCVLVLDGGKQQGKMGTLHTRVADETCRIRLDMRFDTRNQSHFEITARFPIKQDPLRQKDAVYFRKHIVIYADSVTRSPSMEKINSVPDILKNAAQINESVRLGTIYRIDLRYNPALVEMRHMQDIAPFAHERTAQESDAFARQVATGYLTVYSHKPGKFAEDFNSMLDQFKAEIKHEPFSEYRSRNSEKGFPHLLQWGIPGYGSEVDREPPLEQTYYRDIAQYCLTFGYGVMRDADHTFEAVIKCLQTRLPFCFVTEPLAPMKSAKVPRSRDQTFKAYGNGPEDSMIRQLLRVGSEGLLTFDEKPNPFVRPRNGWTYKVISNPSARASFGDLTLLVRRQSSYPVKTVSFANEDMLETSAEQIYLCPEVSDVAPKRLVDCSARLLHGGQGMDLEKLDMVRKFVMGRDHTPDEVDCTLFDHTLRNIPGSKLFELMTRLDLAQKGAIRHIATSPHLFKMVQGPPGTGKSTVLACLMGLCKAFNHSALFCAPSNTAVNELVKKIQARDDRTENPADRVNVIRFHSQNIEGNMVLWLHAQYHNLKTDKASPCLDNPFLKSHGLWKHALQSVGVVDDKGDLDYNFLSKEAKGKGSVTERDSRDQSFLTTFLNPDVALENTYEDAKPTLPSLEEDEIPANDEEKDPEPKSLRSVSRQLMVRTLQTHQYVVSTTSNSASKLLRQDMAATIIAVDEATQDPELATVLPTMQNLESVQSVVLVGDAKQLGPTVISLFQKDPVTQKQVNIFAKPMAKSLVERQYESDYPTYLLNTQYRTVAGIIDFTNHRYYNGKLIDAPSTALSRRPLAQEAVKFLRSTYLKDCEVPKMLLNVTDGVTLSGKSKSRSNPHNVAQAMAFIERLMSSTSFQSKDISIATPYAAQVRTYRQAFEQANKTEFWKSDSRNVFNIKVSTVDSLQGAENKCIIFDLVVSAVRMGGLGFVTDNKRLNVAMTRPEDLLIIIGDRNCHSDEAQFENEPEAAHIQFNDEGQPIEAKSGYSNNLRRLFDYYLGQQLLKAAPQTSSLKQALYVQEIAIAEEFRKEIMSRACSNCGKLGHKSKQCKAKKSLQNVQCHNCQEYGHKAIDCPEDEIFRGTCYACHQPGHRRSECPERLCNTCGGKGHKSHECSKRVCIQCRQEGHTKKECPEIGHRFTFSTIPSNFKEYEAAKEAGVEVKKVLAAQPSGQHQDTVTELDPWAANAQDQPAVPESGAPVAAEEGVAEVDPWAPNAQDQPAVPESGAPAGTEESVSEVDPWASYVDLDTASPGSQAIAAAEQGVAGFDPWAANTQDQPANPDSRALTGTEEVDPWAPNTDHDPASPDTSVPHVDLAGYVPQGPPEVTEIHLDNAEPNSDEGTEQDEVVDYQSAQTELPGEYLDPDHDLGGNEGW